MLALVVDTSAHPRAAYPRAMCHKCYNESIPSCTRLSLKWVSGLLLLSPQESVRSKWD